MAGKSELLELTAEIVSAHFTKTSVPLAELPTLISSVHGALARLGVPALQEPPTPAVPVRRSVKDDHVVCLECGKSFSMLKRHLGTDHGMTPQEYRERWELPSSYPMTAPAYSRRRQDLAKELGLGRKRSAGRG